MDIATRLENDTATLALAGRLDTTTAPLLDNALSAQLDADAAHVVLDFADLSYVSSAGLRVLLIAIKKAKANNKTLTLRHVAPDVNEVFEMTGFAGMLTIE